MMNPPNSPLRIFVSHSHQDNGFGKRLVEDLKRVFSESNVWYDEGLHGGDPWLEKIIEELSACDIFILVLSPDAMSSRWVRHEINIAFNEEKRIVPLLYRPCNIRADLKTIQIISFLPPKTYEEAFAELVIALRQPRVDPTNLDALYGEVEVTQSKGIRQPRVDPTNLDALYGEAVVAESKGNLQRALDLFQQIQRYNPNYRSGMRLEMKRLLQKQVSEASRLNDWVSEVKALEELLRIDPGDTRTQRRLEKLSTTQVQILRQEANRAKLSSAWEREVKAWEGLLRLRQEDPEARRSLPIAKIHFLRKQASDARKKGAWEQEINAWRQLLLLKPEDSQVKRRLSIAETNQQYVNTYEEAVHRFKDGYLDEARERLEDVWQYAPYYGDPERLARKVGILIPVPFIGWRRTLWLLLLACSVLLLVISLILTALGNSLSSTAWIGLIIAGSILYKVSAMWLLFN